MLYDYGGTMVWENKELFGKVVYQADIPEYACAFINDNKTLVCNTGKMYDVSGGGIKELEAEFEFLVVK